MIIKINSKVYYIKHLLFSLKWKSSTTSSSNTRIISNTTHLLKIFNLNASYWPRNISMMIDMIILEIGFRLWDMGSMELCCLLLKIKFCLSTRALGGVILFMGREYCILFHILSQNIKLWGLWKESGEMVFFMEKVALKTIKSQKEGGTLAMKDSLKMDRNLASVLKEWRIQYTEDNIRKVAEQERVVWNGMEETLLTVSLTKVSWWDSHIRAWVIHS